MSSAEHLKILMQGVEAWNQWRQKHPEIRPDLKQADFQELDLAKINFLYADLRYTNLKKAKLSEAHFGRSDLCGAILSEAELSNAKFFEATFNNETIFSNAILFEAKFQAVDLSKVNFHSADLRKADLSGANLREADLSNTDLRETNLKYANLKYANLSKAILDRVTLCCKGIKGCQVGMNGIWAGSIHMLEPRRYWHLDSAALVKSSSRGNSMLGDNVDSIIQSLTQAQRFVASSMLLVGIVLLIATLNLEKITIPNTEILVTPENFILLAMPMSIGFISMSILFIRDSIRGIRIISDRKSAMAIGQFPWVLSKYSAPFIFRIVVSFHGACYPLYYFYIKFLGASGAANQYIVKMSTWPFLVYNIVCWVILVLCSLWLFILSIEFKKPILFDKNTEEENEKIFNERLNSIINIKHAVEKQTGMIKQISETLSSLSQK